MLISIRAVAEKLSVSTRTVRKMLATNRLPAPVRLGRSVRWRETELAEWVNAGCPSIENWRPTPQNTRLAPVRNRLSETRNPSNN